MKAFSVHISGSHKPEINLAYEEYLLTESTEDHLLFYLNDRSVIFGKHQNPWLEINLDYCKQNSISIHRRLSGGGAVYHDLNNINFSFIRNKETDFVNFREHIEPISALLRDAGIPNNITERNDIFIDDFKISGNAEHVNNRKKRILHHGTLLVSSDLDVLRRSLSPEEINIKTHAVSSVRSKVSSIDQHSEFTSAQELMQYIESKLNSYVQVKDLKHVDPSALQEVQELAHQKYSDWDWTYAYSPQFIYSPLEGTEITIRKGQIIEMESTSLPDELIKHLIHSKIKESLIDGKLPSEIMRYHPAIALNT